MKDSILHNKMSRLIVFSLIFLAHSVKSDSSSNQILLESTIIQCSNSEAVTIGSLPMKMASSFHGHVRFDLKLFSKCKKKLFISMKVTDTTTDFISNAIVILTHGKNSITHRVSQFVNPIAVKFEQGKIFHKYPLKLLYRVNGNMSEEILNSERDNKTYSGCDNDRDSNTPTCGFYPSKTKHPAGFCCSCETEKSSVHPRGGQHCSVPGKTPDQLTSAHCLRASSHHYNVFELEQPILYQNLKFEVFRSELKKDGNLTWQRMSASNGVRVDNNRPVGASGVMKVTYLPHLPTTKHSKPQFDIDSQCLLAPSPSQYWGPKDAPEPFKGAPPSQMLIVPKTMLTPLGAQCDKIGVGIEAFVYQENACNVPPNTCLKNQPFDLWKQDQGPKGAASAKFRLSSFRSSENDIPPFADLDGERKSGYLYAEVKVLSPTTVIIEVPADKIGVLSPGYNAFIESVLTDTGDDGAKVVVHIMNKELVPATFTVQLTECSFNILSDGKSGGEGNKTSQPEKIGALEAKHFSLDIHSFYITQTVYCFVLLVNEFGESIAAREITLQPRTTCLCVHTCQCACGEGSNTKCERLADENIIAAGLYHEVMSPEEIEEGKERVTKSRIKTLFHWLLMLHVIVLSIAGGVWILQKCMEPAESEEGKDNKGSETEDSLSSGDSYDGEEGETEEYGEQGQDSATMTDSEVTLYKKGCYEDEDEYKHHHRRHHSRHHQHHHDHHHSHGTPDPDSQDHHHERSDPQHLMKHTDHDEPPVVTLTPINNTMLEPIPSQEAVLAISRQTIDHASPSQEAVLSTSKQVTGQLSPSPSGRVTFKTDVDAHLSKPDISESMKTAAASKILKASKSVTNAPEGNKPLPTVHGEQGGEGSRHIINPVVHPEPSRVTNIPADYSHAVATVPSHIVPPKPSKATKSNKTEKSGLGLETPSTDWDFRNNNDSQIESNIDAFLTFCATTSSSQTSFGTYNRRKRDQYSAYDFLPAPKHRDSSSTWE